MARSGRDSINQRISLEGDEEVRRKLEQIGATGEKALTSISRGAQNITPALQGMESNSRRVGFAVQNLSFQANDLFTGLASGQPAMRIFAQQGGQIFQAFQQGGGLSAVLGGVTTSLKEFITPMRALAGLGAAAAAGIALVGARALSADDAVKQFKVTLDALRAPAFARGGDALKGVGVTPEQLDEAAKRLRSVGLSLSEARKEILEGIRGGIDARIVEEVIKGAKDLDAVFGKGSKGGEAFKKAVEGDAAALRKYGEEIGVLNPRISELQDGLRTVPALIRKITEAPNIKGAADKVLDPIQKQARDINVEFQNILDNVGLFFKEGFVNAVSTGGAAGNMFSALGTAIKEQNWAGIGNAIAAAIFGEGVFSAAIEGLRSQFTSAWTDTETLLAPLRTLGNTIGQTLRSQFIAAWADTAPLLEPFKTLGDAIVETLGTSLSAESIWSGFTSAASAAVERVRGLLASLAEAAAATARAIASAFSASPVATANIPAFGVPDLTGSGGFARGGLVRGPGTGTSDSVPLWGSDGEYINTERAVRFWGTGLFDQLNRLQMPKFAMGGLIGAMSTPLVPRSRGFAAGGLVAAGAGAGGGGNNLTLVLDGERFQAQVRDDDVFNSLTRVARRKAMLSAGRKPSSVGGRRYGG